MDGLIRPPQRRPMAAEKTIFGAQEIKHDRINVTEPPSHDVNAGVTDPNQSIGSGRSIKFIHARIQ